MDQLKPFRRKPVPFTLDNGETVYLRRLSAADYIEWQEHEDTRPFDSPAHLIALSVCDEQENRLFRDSELDLVKQIDLVTVKQLGNFIYETNGLKPLVPASPAVVEAPLTEDAKKKPESDSTPS